MSDYVLVLRSSLPPSAVTAFPHPASAEDESVSSLSAYRGEDVHRTGVSGATSSVAPPTVALSGLANACATSSTQLQLQQPSKEIRAQLLAIPATGRSMKGGSRVGKKGKKQKFLSKVFNPQAGRPQPTLLTPYSEYRSTMEFSFTFLVTSATVPVFVAYSVALSGFADYTQYTALFDEYKIEELEIWIEPSIVMSPTAGSTMFCSAIDVDDANVPSAFADVCMRQGNSISETGTGHYHKWKPSVANALYSGAFTSYGSEPAPWIDCASPSVAHYGVKAGTLAADGVARTYYGTYRAMVAFRGAAI